MCGALPPLHKHFNYLVHALLKLWVIDHHAQQAEVHALQKLEVLNCDAQQADVHTRRVSWPYAWNTNN